jgi:anti-sigma B factor antagonist
MGSTGQPAVTDRPPAFAIERASLKGAPGVLVRGEVDLATAPTLTEELDAAMRDGEGAFVVDLCDVSFLDSSGVGVLLHARAVLGREERDFVVVCPPGAVRRIFEMAGIDDLFAMFDSRDEAAASLQPIGCGREGFGRGDE